MKGGLDVVGWFLYFNMPQRNVWVTALQFFSRIFHSLYKIKSRTRADDISCRADTGIYEKGFLGNKLPYFSYR